MCSRSSAGSLHPAGSAWTHFNAAARWPRKQRAQLYGANDMAIGQPNLLHMTAAQLVYPLYTVQVYICPTSLDLHAHRFHNSFVGPVNRYYICCC